MRVRRYLSPRALGKGVGLMQPAPRTHELGHTCSRRSDHLDPLPAPNHEKHMGTTRDSNHHA